jgi:hypothetical protein
VIPLIVSGQWLLLFKISGSSLNESIQTLPKWPVSAIIRLSRDVSASPDTRMVCGLAGSLLVTVIVANLLPGLVGSKRRGMGSESPTPTTRGKNKTSGTRKSAEEDAIAVIERTHRLLLFKTSGLSTKEPAQT